MSKTNQSIEESIKMILNRKKMNATEENELPFDILIFDNENQIETNPATKESVTLTPIQVSVYMNIKASEYFLKIKQNDEDTKAKKEIIRKGKDWFRYKYPDIHKKLLADQVQVNESEPNQMNDSEANSVNVAPPVSDPDQMNLDESNPLIITGTKRKFTEFNENGEVSDELNDKATKRSFNNHPNASTFDVQDEEQVSENPVQKVKDTSVQKDTSVETNSIGDQLG